MATRSQKGWGGRRRFLFRRRKYCKFCESKTKWIDHKDVKVGMPVKLSIENVDEELKLPLFRPVNEISIMVPLVNRCSGDLRMVFIIGLSTHR